MCILEDNLISDNYFYEICVQTGTNLDAATKSKVYLIINGEYGETIPRNLCNKSHQVFSRGGLDSFLMSVKHPLGELNYLRIWHDNR